MNLTVAVLRPQVVDAESVLRLPGAAKEPRKRANRPYKGACYWRLPGAAKEPRKRANRPYKGACYWRLPGAAKEPRKEAYCSRLPDTATV